MLDDETFRGRLREVVTRSGLSRRAASLAMGRDVGYVAALLDPRRASRARPTPGDMLRLSDATGISFVELLELLWGVSRERLAMELAGLGMGGSLEEGLAGLSDEERRSVADFAAFLLSRHGRPARRRRATP